MDASQARFADALRLTLAAATFELLLLRATAGPPSLVDFAAALALAVALAGVIRAATRLSPRLGVAASGLPIALYGSAILVPPLLDYATKDVGVATVLALVAYAALRRVPRRRLRWVAPRECVAWLASFVLLSGATTVAVERSQPATPVLAAGLAALAIPLAAGPWAFLALPLALLPASQPAETWSAAGPASARPDVLLVSVDTLRADSAATMDSHRALARTGVAFDGQASSPWTLPSLATLMTGLEPAGHGAGRSPEGFHGIEPGVTTLAEALAAAGYDTAATVENPFAGAAFGLDRGFARFRFAGYERFSLPRVFLGDRCRALAPALLARLGLVAPLPDGAWRHAADVGDFVRERRARPLFVWAHLLEPHIPYRNAFGLELPWRDEWQLATIGRGRADEIPPPETLARYRAAYDHEVRVVDAAVAAMLEAFPPGPHGRIVVFTSDHGEEFLEHGAWEHGHTMYQELLAVPLVIEGIEPLAPGVAGLVDVVPTLLAALDLAPPAPLDGRDLARPGVAPLRSSSSLYAGPELRAVRLGARKLIAGSEPQASYDLAADPAEQRPLEPAPDLVPLLPPAWSADGRAPRVLDPELRERLRALGYVR